NRTKDSKKSMKTIKTKGEVEIEDESDVDERLGCTATNMDNQEEEMSKLFQIKRAKVNALVDTGSQSNLIFEVVVHNLGLDTYEHLHPYPLGWVKKGVQIQLTKRLRFNLGSIP
ncbi:hypothetical protein KI387_044461, partial [Taxus chinensis]